MLCCLVGALLAGKLVVAWRLLGAAVGRPAGEVARRAALACAVVLVPLAALVALAGHAGHESGGAPPSALAAAIDAPPLCSGLMPAPERP